MRNSLTGGARIALALALFATPLFAQLAAPNFPHTQVNPSLTDNAFAYVANSTNCPWVATNFDIAIYNANGGTYCPGSGPAAWMQGSLSATIYDTQQYKYLLPYCAAYAVPFCENVLTHVNRDYWTGEPWTYRGILDMADNTSTGNEVVSPSQLIHGAFDNTGSTYTDVTCHLSGVSPCNIPVSIAAGHTLYMGYIQPIDRLNFLFTTPAVNSTVTYQYWNGSTWADLTAASHYHDGTAVSGKSLSQNGQVYFYPPSDWRRTTVSTASHAKYWIRLTTSAATTITSVQTDDWASTSPCTDCGTHANANMRGWSWSAWNASNACSGSGFGTSGNACKSDGMPFNPNPPAVCTGVMANNCATAEFPYQGRFNAYGGSPNEYWPMPDNVNATTSKRTMGELAAYVISQTLASGTLGAIWDNVGAAMGGINSVQPPMSSLVNNMDYGCAPTCGTLNNMITTTYIPAYAELRTVVKAQQGSSYLIDYNVIDANGSIPNATFLGQTGDVYNGEFFVNNIPSPHSMRFQTADDTLSANNVNGAVDYLQFIEAPRWQYSDAGANWHLWDEGDRGPMMALAEFYMVDAWCNATRANCFNGAASVHNYTGISWGTSPSAVYTFTGEAWAYTTASGTLSTALPAGPAGVPYDIYLSDDTNVVPTGGPIYAANYQFEFCLVADTDFQHCDRFPTQKIGPRHYQTLNLSSLGFQPVINSYPAGAGTVTRFATTVYRNTGANPSYKDTGKNWSIWWPAMGVDVGKPDPSGYNHGVRSCGATCATTALPAPPAAFATGPNITCIGHAGLDGCPVGAPASCAHGTTHGDLWRRDFTKAVIFIRDYGTGFCTDDFDWASRDIDLTSLQSGCAPSCEYYQLHSDGTTTGPVTTLNIRAGEAFIGLPAASGTLDITTSSLPGGFLGTAYSTPVTATGGTPPYSWALSAGSMCTGLSLSATGTPSATISGNPTSVQACSFTVQVTDDVAATATQALSITIVGYPPLIITTSPCQGGTIFVAYGGCTQSYTGGNGHNTWSVLTGALPSGLSMNGTTGAITGTPSVSGSFPFTTKVTDTESPPQVATQAQSISIAGSGSLIIVTGSLPNGTVGQPYSKALAATGGTPPYTWSVLTGTLPAPLGLSSGGTISGTPSMGGSSPSPLTIKVTDAVAGTNLHPYTLLIGPARGATGSGGEISLGEILH